MKERGKIINFGAAKQEKEDYDFVQQGIKMFTKEVLPYMTQQDFVVLSELHERRASNEEWAHELAKIKTRIDIENDLV